MHPVTTIRLDPEIKVQLDKIAEQIDRPRAWVIQEALLQYIDREAWYLEAVQKGLDDAEAGRMISHNEVKERLRARGINVE